MILDSPTTLNEHLRDSEERELIEYAKYLGMNLPEDDKFLYLAREGLQAEVPDGWKEFVSEKGEVYYYNEKQQKTQWNHPRDQDYKEMFQKLKKEDEERRDKNYNLIQNKINYLRTLKGESESESDQSSIDDQQEKQLANQYHKIQMENKVDQRMHQLRLAIRKNRQNRMMQREEKVALNKIREEMKEEIDEMKRVASISIQKQEIEQLNDIDSNFEDQISQFKSNQLLQFLTEINYLKQKQSQFIQKKQVKISKNVQIKLDEEILPLEKQCTQERREINKLQEDITQLEEQISTLTKNLDECKQQEQEFKQYQDFNDNYKISFDTTNLNSSSKKRHPLLLRAQKVNNDNKKYDQILLSD